MKFATTCLTMIAPLCALLLLLTAGTATDAQECEKNQSRTLQSLFLPLLRSSLIVYSIARRDRDGVGCHALRAHCLLMQC